MIVVCHTANCKKFCTALYTMQAYDANMNQHNQLRLYSKTESELDIASDPLVFLGCGHVIHMTSMDQYMALEEAYIKQDGHWTAPCQLGVCAALAYTAAHSFSSFAVSFAIPVLHHSLWSRCCPDCVPQADHGSSTGMTVTGTTLAAEAGYSSKCA